MRSSAESNAQNTVGCGNPAATRNQCKLTNATESGRIIDGATLSVADV